ncbi:hypothetical protein K493DRAFT_109624 [Basidiobolus meristosporus CBS 931.73]|uniref:Uncharacterized protein n=1 Tax=Basidiobolus meristosporus CBS 931.73 TaxID=1314790 RepID=A0A1Y1YNG9_9FUNG|nr:hypothetical protein K493DRAFT_109624 [Basidiobolus meristosporus CBS 931.73]|eukprot:ORX99515.1 hypothetical protein K493DRAFT_109624 [Basidiobolus meristosporus CBS 931.73]
MEILLGCSDRLLGRRYKCSAPLAHSTKRQISQAMRPLLILSLLGVSLVARHVVTSSPVPFDPLPKKYYGKFSRYTDYPENYADWVPDDGGWLYHEDRIRERFRHQLKHRPNQAATGATTPESPTEADHAPPNQEAKGSEGPASPEGQPERCARITAKLVELGIRGDAMVCLDATVTIDFLKSPGISPQVSQVNGLMSSEEVAAKCDLIKTNVIPLAISSEAVVCLPNIIQIMLT